MIDTAKLQSDLMQFTGSMTFYRHGLMKSLVYTEGVQFLAQNAECYWLIDAIASYQPQCRKDPSLREFQVWTLKKKSDYSFVLLGERDTNDPNAIIQEIEHSDFPLQEIKFFVSYGEDADEKPYWTIYLPSEH